LGVNFAYNDKKVVSVFVRFSLPLWEILILLVGLSFSTGLEIIGDDQEAASLCWI
jgi:hypothetical protein